MDEVEKYEDIQEIDAHDDVGFVHHFHLEAELPHFPENPDGLGSDADIIASSEVSDRFPKRL